MKNTWNKIITVNNTALVKTVELYYYTRGGYNHSLVSILGGTVFLFIMTTAQEIRMKAAYMCAVYLSCLFSWKWMYKPYLQVARR